MTQGNIGFEEQARPATIHDLSVVTALAQHARDTVRDVRGGDLWVHHHAEGEPLDAIFANAMVDDDALVVVGHIDGTVIGYALASLTVLRDGRKLAVIEELFVLPGARGVGVGEQILASLLAWGNQRGCFGIDSLALPGDRATKNFFETFGMKARAILVHAALTGEGSGDKTQAPKA